MPQGEPSKQSSGACLNETDLSADPFTQFRQWLQEAAAVGLKEPGAMTLATATPEGIPSARVVLLRGIDARGFLFYTNYDSRKGQELAANPRAALVFYWHPLDRQVRIEGAVERATPQESDAYFQCRPRGSCISAWASPQSEVITDRRVLESRSAELSAQFGAGPIPRPPFWGGYRVVPTSIEFWQGRLNRLHDRLRYRRLDHGDWRLERLAP